MAYQSAMNSVSNSSNVEEDVSAPEIKEWTKKQMKRRTAARKFLAASIQVYQSTGGGGMGALLYALPAAEGTVWLRHSKPSVLVAWFY